MNERIPYHSNNIDEYNFTTNRYNRVDGQYEPFVYIIEEKASNIRYIGSRTAKKCLESDLGVKYFTSCNKINWKDNLDSYTIVDIIPCVSNHDAIILEIELLIETGAIWSDRFYNLSVPGLKYNQSGKTHSEETKMKLREKRKGKKPALGMKHTDETKMKLREKRKGKKPALGMKHTEETKNYLSKIRRGALKNREFTDDTKKKMSISAKKRINDIGSPTQKRWKIIDPNGNVYIIDYSIKLFCEEKGLSMYTLKKYKNISSVPQHSPNNKNNIERIKTSGWRLFDDF